MLGVTVGNVRLLSLPVLRAAVWAFWARSESTRTSISERVSDNLLDGGR